MIDAVRSLRLPALIAGVVALSCSAERPAAPREDRSASLGGQVAARVGEDAIPLSVVASVADAQGLSARDAAAKVIDDAVAAAAARGRSLDRRPPAAWRLTSALARMTSDRLFEDAKRMGPPTDREIQLLSERHWAEVDRPPSFRVIHAIVLRPKDAAATADARALADVLHDAVAPSTDRDEFKARASAVPHDPKLEIRVEDLPPFTDEGWVTEGAGRMDEVFARASAALPSPGATSAVVETSFGWHVIRLLERLPERRMPVDARRVAFTREAYAMRAQEALRARLDALRAANTVSVSPAAEQLMRSVTFAPSEAAISP